MAVNIQTDTSLVNNYADNQNAFNNAYDTTTKRLDAIQTGREKATVNKLYGESLNSDGTLDTNKLTQGMASTGLGAKIPELLAQKNQQVLDNLKLEIDNITTGQKHLEYMGQLAGGQKGKGIAGLKTVKDEYRRKGWDLSRFPPDPQTDDDANGQLNTIIDSSSTELERQKQDAAIQQKRDDYELRKNMAAIAQATLENSQRHQGVVENQGQQKIDSEDANNRAQLEAKEAVAKEKAAAKKVTDWQKTLPAGVSNQYTDISKEESSMKGSVDKVDELLIDPAFNDINIWQNKVAGVQNALGLETPASKFASKIRSTLDGITNEDLRLNKGAQTNFDYDNAKKALLTSLDSNNPVLIKQALDGFKNERTKMLSTVTKLKTGIERQYPWATTGAEMPESTTTAPAPVKDLAAQMAKVPAGTPDTAVEAYKKSLNAKGYK